MKKISLLTIGAALLLTGACGGKDGPTTPGTGSSTFQVAVTGDLQANFGGDATFASGSDGNGGTISALMMKETGANASGTIIFSSLSDLPPVGTYQFVDGSTGGPAAQGELYGGLFDGPLNNPSAAFDVTSGTLTITVSTATQLKGTFTVQATGAAVADPNTQLNVTATGSFTAKPGILPTFRATRIKVEQ